MQLALSNPEYQRQCLLAAYSSRLNPFALDPRERELLSDWVAEQQHRDYLTARNGVLRLWTRNPLVSVTAEEAMSCVKSKSQHRLALVAHEWLTRHGYINFGCVEITSPARPLLSASLQSRTVVIVGAGVAGLSCARQLQGLFVQFRERWHQTYGEGLPKIVLLEGRSRVGGRVYSHPLAAQHPHSLPHELSNTAEMGAQIITGFDSGNPLDAVVRGQLALEHHFLRDKMLLYDFDGTVIDDERRDTYIDKLFNSVLEVASKYSWKFVHKATTEQKLEESGSSANGFKTKGSSDRNGAVKLPTTLGSMMDQLIHEYQIDDTLSPLDLRLLNWHYANLEYANAANVNLLSLGGWDQDGGNEFEGRHSQVIGGYSQLPRGLWKYPNELDVRLNKTVKNIQYKLEGGDRTFSRARVECDDGECLDANYIVSTLPLGILKEKRVTFDPELPQFKRGAIERLGYGLLNKVILVFDHVFWDIERDMFGRLNEPLYDLNDLNQKHYSINRGKFYLFWNCVKTSGRPMLVALLAGDAAYTTEFAKDKAIIDDVLDKLQGVFKLTSLPAPIEVLITRWKTDRFSRGSYSYIGETTLPGDYDAMARPVEGQLFFAGEATCRTHPATVHGAYLSGLRAASEVLEAYLGPIPVPRA